MTELIRQELTRNPFRAVLAAGLRPRSAPFAGG